ncbi:hypothetical protein C8T65DRAFT_152012 [Cerioporus squamosus]|nr:hypothetical protein C8T65DRAFT_152012 [Cerioporus squamosus]
MHPESRQSIFFCPLVLLGCQLLPWAHSGWPCSRLTQVLGNGPVRAARIAASLERCLRTADCPECDAFGRLREFSSKLGLTRGPQAW